MAKLKEVDFVLTELQERFVDYFVGECEFDPIVSLQRAGYKTSGNKYTASMRILGSTAVRRAIHQRLHESTFWISQEAIVQQLWKEALTAKTDGARINALVWLGKHIGMWQEKAIDPAGNVTYNVVNYSINKEDIIKTIEATPEVEQTKDKVALPEGVQVLQFKKVETNE